MMLAALRLICTITAAAAAWHNRLCRLAYVQCWYDSEYCTEVILPEIIDDLSCKQKAINSSIAQFCQCVIIAEGTYQYRR